MNAAIRLPLISAFLLALLLRAVLPSGWMPVQSASGISIVLCSTSGSRTMLFDPGDDSTPSAPTACAYAVMAMVAAHAPPVAFPLRLALPIAVTGPKLSGVTVRFHRARPPPTAPPAFPSA